MIIVVTTADELDRAGEWTAQAVLALRAAEAAEPPVTVHFRDGCPVSGCTRTDEHPHRPDVWRATEHAMGGPS